jgi:hypothetical protein
MTYLVDECFRAEVDAKAWTPTGHGYWVHGGSNKPSERCLLHQFVWRLSGRPLPEQPLSIDHINRDPSDNRLENLRVASPTLQLYNTRPRHRHTHRLPRGVYFMASNGKKSGAARAKPYAAKVCHRGKQIYCGYYDTPEEAAVAVNRKREELASAEETRVKELMT